MIELTQEQRQELGGPGFARARDPQTQEVYVLVPAEVYDHFQDLLAPERLPHREQQAILRDAGKRAFWGDPEMDVYDREEAARGRP